MKNKEVTMKKRLHMQLSIIAKKLLLQRLEAAFFTKKSIVS